MAKQKQTAAQPPGEIELDLDQLVESVLPTQQRRQARLQRNSEKFEAGLATLGNSIIETGGVIQSIIVRPRPDMAHRGKKDVYEIAVGWRRWMASKKVGLKSIRCVARELTDTQILEWQYDENHGREGSSALDDADYFRHLHERENYSLEQIADRHNKKLSEVEDLLALNGLHPELTREFDEGLLPMKHAVYLAKFFSSDVQEQICKEALAYHYNERKYGAVSFKVFKEEVEENFVRLLAKVPFDTEDERLFMKGETVAAKCSDCSQRTGFNTLFREISENDSCLNRACFQFKTNVYLRLQREAIAQDTAINKPIDEAVKDVPLVTERKYVADRQPFKEKVQTEVEILDESECEFSTLALAVEGSKKGQKVWICSKKEKGEHCAVHNPPPAEVKPTAEMIEKREREINERVREQLREKIFTKAIEAFDDYTPVWMFDDLVKTIVYNLFVNNGTDTKRFVCKIGGWNFPTGGFTAREVMDAIEKLTLADRSRLIFLLLTAKHGFLPGQDSTDELKKIAKDYAGIDYDALEAELRLELTPVEMID